METATGWQDDRCADHVRWKTANTRSFIGYGTARLRSAGRSSARRVAAARRGDM
jgi:hypothetical protein